MLKNYIEHILNIFNDSNEGLILFDEEGNILHSNNSAKRILGQFNDIANIGQRCSFDVCVLNEDDILKFNPIQAALYCVENFKAEASYQTIQNTNKKLIIRSFNEDNRKVILISDISCEIENLELKKQSDVLKESMLKLEKDNKDYASLKERAESQAIRTGLIHRISTSIRDTLDIEEIIKTALSEISRTLGIYRGYYASYNEKKLVIKYNWFQENFIESGIEIDFDQDFTIKEVLLGATSQISSSFEENINSVIPRLITPVVYRGKIQGILSFYFKNQNRQWHTEEISMVEAVAAQLATAINQASLFVQLDNKNTELEGALNKLKTAQTQLIQSEKMASLGKLVAGVAHEINTPLGAINSNNGITRKIIEKNRSIDTNNQQIIKFFDILSDINSVNDEAISRINSIVKSLKNFARLDEAELKEVDIHEGLRNTIKLLNHETKNRIKIVEEYADLPLVKCYPNLLNQVFMNVLINAIQSIQDIGVVKITTSMLNEYVYIEICDTGCGIYEYDIPKIYDPGYTTKGVGVGTGLGLSICYQIIEKHKGSISVESTIGSGTTFTLCIPQNLYK